MEVALYSLAGIAVGATLQYVFTRILEDRRHKREMRTQAYSDYLKCVAEMKHTLIQPTAPRERELLARFTDAKIRLTLYGSALVVKNLSQFEKMGGQVQTEKQVQAFLNVIDSMRDEASVTADDLKMIIIGPE